MNRLATILMTLAVAGAVLTSALVSAQVAKEARPAEKAEFKKVQVKKELMKKAATAVRAMPAGGGGGFMLGNAAGGEAQAKAFVDQFTRQLRPLLRGQLHVIKVVCEPTKEQQTLIARDGHKLLEEVAKQCSENQMGMQRGMAVRMAGAAIFDPRELIRDGLLKAVKAHLPPEKAGRYQAEVDDQIASRKRTAARSVVARLDEELILTAEQRDKLTESLAKSDENAILSFSENFNSGAYLPAIQDRFVTPFLTQAQLQVWRGAQKVNFGTTWMNFGGMAVSEEDLAEYDEPAEKKAGDDKPAEKQAFPPATFRAFPAPATPAAVKAVAPPAAK